MGSPLTDLNFSEEIVYAYLKGYIPPGTAASRVLKIHEPGVIQALLNLLVDTTKDPMAAGSEDIYFLVSMLVAIERGIPLKIVGDVVMKPQVLPEDYDQVGKWVNNLSYILHVTLMEYDGLVEIKEDAFITKDGDLVFEITEKGRLLYAAMAKEEAGNGAAH